MNPITCRLLICLIVLFSETNVVAQEPESLQRVAKPVTLFDGTDLRHWLSYSNNPTVALGDVWRVENGVLKCKGKPSGYLQTKRWYRDYEFNVNWRWPEGSQGGNSGVLVHTTIPLLFYGWPKSMEVQLRSTYAGEFWVIGDGVDVRVEDEEQRRGKPVAGNQHVHRRIKRLPGDFEKPIGQWNQMKIICRGDEIKIWVNGELANHGTGMTINQGAIALQSEGTAIEFKDISIKPLTDK